MDRIIYSSVMFMTMLNASLECLSCGAWTRLKEFIIKNISAFLED